MCCGAPRPKYKTRWFAHFKKFPACLDASNMVSELKEQRRVRKWRLEVKAASLILDEDFDENTEDFEPEGADGLVVRAKIALRNPLAHNFKYGKASPRSRGRGR